MGVWGIFRRIPANLANLAECLKANSGSSLQSLKGALSFNKVLYSVLSLIFSVIRDLLEVNFDKCVKRLFYCLYNPDIRFNSQKRRLRT